MNKFLFLTIVLIGCNGLFAQHEYIERQGQITFFSYTPVENIQANNNQALSLFNIKTNEIAVRILMKAFAFKKTLMHEHFNESYIESDLYREATFSGQILDFNEALESQTRIIKGDFTLKNKTTPIEIKATITKLKKTYNIEGSFNVLVNDYDIKIPPLLSPNIAKKIEVSFNFKHVPNEK